MSTKDTKKTSSKSVTKGVMEQIESGNAHMKSKWHFHALSFLLGLSVFFTSALTALFINLSVSSVHERELLALNEFGGPGRLLLLQQIPWLLVGAIVVTGALAFLLVTKYELTYKHRFYGLLVVFVLVIATMSSVFALSGFDDSAREFGPLRDAGRFEQLLDDKRVGGEVIEVAEEIIVVEDRNGDEVEIDISQLDDDLRIAEGDFVGAFGEYQGETFHAEKLRTGDKHKPPNPPHRRSERPDNQD